MKIENKVITNFDDLVFPTKLKEELKATKQNIIAQGRPGTGKTSLIYCLAEYHKYELSFINGALENGVNVARSIEERINHFPEDGKEHIAVVFNESERLTKDLQAGLKTIIELRDIKADPDFGVAWLFTSNYDNFDDAITSRCYVINFDELLLNDEYVIDMSKQLANKTIKILQQQFTLDEIKSNFTMEDFKNGLSDMRQWISKLYLMLDTGKLEKITLRNEESEIFGKFGTALQSGKHKEAMSVIKSIQPDSLLYYFQNTVLPQFDDNYHLQSKLADILHEYDYKLRVVRFPYLANYILVSNLIKFFRG